MPTRTPEIAGIQDARAMLGGLAKSTVYKLAQDGEIERVELGGRAMFVVASIAAYIERQRERTRYTRRRG